MKANSKNIRVFPDWFGIDSKSKRKELEVCNQLFDIIKDNTWEWSSDKGGFWVEERNFYYKHICDNDKFFNYPIQIPVIDGCKVIKTEKKYVGKIAGNEAKRTTSEELDQYYVDAALKDVKENPIKEDGFDWEHVKQTMESE